MPQMSASTSAAASAAHQLQAHAQVLQQGFQLYAGLKSGGVGSPVASTSTSVASSSAGTSSSTQSAADALKVSAGGMVPGSAFNFAPPPNPLGLYGEQSAASSYLDQFRDAANPYYMPPAPAHSGPTSNPAGNGADKGQNPLNPAATSYPFFASRAAAAAAGYAIGPDGSPVYQQYLSRDTFHARMIFNQAAAAAAVGYVQPPPPPSAYRPAALGMAKPYDINRQSWF